nr:hypothetical protein [Tanacetum cinerariifolium]
MHTRSSSNLSVVSSNPLYSNPKRRNRRRSKQPFILDESPVDTMADQRTMAELLRAPTEGYAEAIVAWDKYKYLLRDCPHYGFTELHQLDTFYNALNPTDQDSLNAAAGGNLLERRTQDVLTIIENKSKQTSVVATAMTAILKQFQATPPPASVKAVEEIYVTCGGAHPYYQCLAAGGNTFLELRDNIQGYVSVAAVNYNQGNSGYRPLGSGSLPNNTIANPKGKLKAITTRSGHVLDGPTVPTPPTITNPEVDEHVEETLTDPNLSEYTIKVPPPPLHINITLANALILVPKYQKILKVLHSNKEKLQELANTPLNENFSAVILKKLPEKLGDSRKFLIPCGFSKLKCKALADLGDSINLMPISVWKKLSLPELISTRMTLELANRAICTPARIARDVFVLVGKFTFSADFVIVDYESDHRVPLILGRPFLRTARALIDVHGLQWVGNGVGGKCGLKMYSNMNYKIDLLTQEYEKFSISNEETLNSGFTRFNAIITSLKSLDSDYSSKNHIRKFIRSLPLKWRAKLMAIKEAKDLATLPLDELIINLKVYEMVLDNDGVGSKTNKEKIKSLAHKAKVTREQTSDDSDSQGGSDEDIDEEEEVEEFNLLARNFYKFFRKGNRFGRGNQFVNGEYPFGKGRGNSLKNKDDWIVDSGCTKHITWNRRLFTSYKAYDGGHVIFGSNLKVKVVGGGPFTSQSNENVERTYHSKAYIVLNKETIRIEESLKVTFDASLPDPDSSSSIEDDRIDEPILQDLNGSPLLKVNVLDEGYPKSLKEARGHPIEQVIGKLNKRTLSSKTKEA